MPAYSLTGKTRFRTNFLGRLILQVEVRETWGLSCMEQTSYHWRDAKTEDFSQISVSSGRYPPDPRVLIK